MNVVLTPIVMVIIVILGSLLGYGLMAWLFGHRSE